MAKRLVYSLENNDIRGNSHRRTGRRGQGGNIPPRRERHHVSGTCPFLFVPFLHNCQFGFTPLIFFSKWNKSLKIVSSAKTELTFQVFFFSFVFVAKCLFCFAFCVLQNRFALRFMKFIYILSKTDYR